MMELIFMLVYISVLLLGMAGINWIIDRFFR